MSDSRLAFEGLGAVYNAHRPAYPAAALAALRAYAGNAAQTPEPFVVADVGAGTGISTRALRVAFGAGARIVGVEPGPDMRRVASESVGAGEPTTYVAGGAESLPFEAGAVDVVVAAQALQWFDRPAFYAQAHRVLRAHGALAILQNNRDWRREPFLAAYEDLLERYSPAYSRAYRAFDVAAELAAQPWLEDVRTLAFGWTNLLRKDEYVAFARSSTKVQAAITAHGETAVVGAIKALLDRVHPGDGSVPVRVAYTCELFLGRRRAR